MDRLKKQYDAIKPSEDLLGGIEKNINVAKKKRKVYSVVKTTSLILVVLMIFVALPNISYEVADAVQDIPLVGKLFEITTFRSYSVDKDFKHADVTIPQIIPEEHFFQSHSSKEVDNLLKSIDQINFDIRAEADKIVDRFTNSINNNESAESIYIDSKIVTDTERYFSINLILYSVKASGYEINKHYTIDKVTGKVVTLRDLCGDNYIELISDNIREQMIEQMESNSNIKYWIDDKVAPEFEFKEIPPDQDFYINKNGKLVISFDEYVVAPGDMGIVEFIID